MRGAGYASFLLHTSVAMVVCPMVALAACLGSVIFFNNSHGINSVLNAGGAASPFLWWPGLILGLLVNRLVPKSTACWVWRAGMVLMACGLFVSLFSYHSASGQHKKRILLLRLLQFELLWRPQESHPFFSTNVQLNCLFARSLGGAAVRCIRHDRVRKAVAIVLYARETGRFSSASAARYLVPCRFSRRSRSRPRTDERRLWPARSVPAFR
jgi:hypothetical protein